MRYTLTIRENEFDALIAEIFSIEETEGAAYLLCGVSKTESEYRLVVRSVHPVKQAHYRRRERAGLSIVSESYVQIAKSAVRDNAAIVFVHSHPDGPEDFSPQDDLEDPKLHRFFHARLSQLLHASLVVARFDGIQSVRGRVWTDDGWVVLDRIRIQGARFRFIDRGSPETTLPVYFDRQVRALGKVAQLLLKRLHVGVVGVGGTGSAVVEQLARLGIGTISIFDKDLFDETNVNRVYGSSTCDGFAPKTGIAGRNVAAMAIGCTVNRIFGDITQRETALRLRDCDVVFGCTDRQSPRDILVRLSTWYLIPVFDLGVVVVPEGEGDDARIRDVLGRVTTVLSGEACLHCRGRIDANVILAESLPKEELQRRIAEGYLRGLEENAPAIIPFTTAVAAQGVAELLHRLVGFMGTERRSSEVLLFFNQSRVRTNRADLDPECFCNAETHRAKGDARDALGLPGFRESIP